jgi:hypothetical protein
VLNNSQQVTVCCWIYKNGPGENALGNVINLDEERGDAAFFIRQDGNTRLLIVKNPGTSGSQGVWSTTVAEGAWNAICVRLDFSDDNNEPTVRVNFTPAPATELSPPIEIQDPPAPGYCVGNRSAQDRTWDGRIAHMQVFNTILSDADADAALRNPGSVTAGLRLYLPMTKASDTSDVSGNGFDGDPTDLANGSNSPPIRSIFHFGATSQTLYQLVIPSNASEPAEGVIGLGTRTKLAASNTLVGGTQFITTQGYPAGPSTVIEPTVRDV